MTIRFLAVAALGAALLVAGPVWAVGEKPEEGQKPSVEQVAGPIQYVMQPRTGPAEEAGPTLYRVGARTDGHFHFNYPYTGVPYTLPMIPASLIATSGLGLGF